MIFHELIIQTHGLNVETQLAVVLRVGALVLLLWSFDGPFVKKVR